jgi:hypothetical protein
VVGEYAHKRRNEEAEKVKRIDSKSILKPLPYCALQQARLRHKGLPQMHHVEPITQHRLRHRHQMRMVA